MKSKVLKLSVVVLIAMWVVGCYNSSQVNTETPIKYDVSLNYADLPDTYYMEYGTVENCVKVVKMNTHYYIKTYEGVEFYCEHVKDDTYVIYTRQDNQWKKLQTITLKQLLTEKKYNKVAVGFYSVVLYNNRFVYNKSQFYNINNNDIKVKVYTSTLRLGMTTITQTLYMHTRYAIALAYEAYHNNVKTLYRAYKFDTDIKEFINSDVVLL